MSEHIGFLDAHDVAAILSIPVNTVYDYAIRGIGPRSFKIGRHRRWDRQDVLEWIATQRALTG
ncbi:MAG: helix-turn-helix transcriptional regulator [Solirubrobacterales bacterium]